MFFSYVTGDLIQIAAKLNRGVAVKILSGFVVLLCVFHLISIPFMFGAGSFTTLYYIYLASILAIAAAYIVISILKKRVPLQDDLALLHNVIRRKSFYQILHWLMWIAVILLILWHMKEVIVHIKFNVDDNFYVAESLTTLSRDTIMDTLPSCGIDGSVFPATYKLVSWELWISVLTRLFGTTPAVLCHSILPALLIPLQYMAYYIVGREFFKKRTSAFLMFVIFLNFMSGPSTYSQGAFLTLRIWQGKSVLVNIIMPLLLYLFIKMIKRRRVTLTDQLALFAVLLVSQAATTVGAYLTPVLYAVYAVTLLIILRKPKPFLKLLMPALFITPFVAAKLLLLINAGSLSSLSEGSGVHERSFNELFNNYFGLSLVIVFFILSIVIITFTLNTGPEKNLRFFFLISSLILIVFFINPLVMPFVESYITGVGVYWRMFWLLQPAIIIATGLTALCEIPKTGTARLALLLFCMICVLVSGRSIFKDEDYKESFKNRSKVSATTQKIVRNIRNDLADDEDISERDVILLVPRKLSFEVRQYADIPLIYYPYYTNNYTEYQTLTERFTLQSLYSSVYRKKTWTAEDMLRSAQILGLDYIAIGSGTAEKNAGDIPAQFELLYKGSRYSLYKTNADSSSR